MRLWTTKPRSSPSMDRFKGEFFYRKSMDTIDFFSILFRGFSPGISHPILGISLKLSMMESIG
jgi:hypothetical protein